MHRAIEDTRLEAVVATTQPVAGLSSGSALLRAGNVLWAVHDDAYRVTRIALPSFATSHWTFAGDGAPLPKSAKPDFESALRTSDGAIHLLGSGSAPARCRIARLQPDAETASLDERPQLYRAVSEALGGGAPANIEGAIVEGERLRLFHRGTGAAPSAIAELPLGCLHDEAPRVLALELFELGALDGVQLAFTDAAVLGDGRCAFAATAEATADPVLDGPVAGSVLGVLEGGAARWTRLRNAGGRAFPDKVEGLAIDADGRGAWILTDADDPARAALLGRVELRGF